MRRCNCPRGEPMIGMPESIKYRYGDRCRKRAYRARVKIEAEAAARAVAPSLSAARAAMSTGARAGHAQNGQESAQRGRTRRPRPAELRVSLRKAERHAEKTRSPDIAAEVRGVLREVLTERQRAALRI